MCNVQPDVVDVFKADLVDEVKRQDSALLGNIEASGDKGDLRSMKEALRKVGTVLLNKVFAADPTPLLSEGFTNRLVWYWYTFILKDNVSP